MDITIMVMQYGDMMCMISIWIYCIGYIYILPSLYVDIMQYDGILQYEGNGINHRT